MRRGSTASVGEDMPEWAGSLGGPSRFFEEKGKEEWEAGLMRVGQGERGCNWDVK